MCHFKLSCLLFIPIPFLFDTKATVFLTPPDITNYIAAKHQLVLNTIIT